jgi:hypothetical protein
VTWHCFIAQLPRPLLAVSPEEVYDGDRNAPRHWKSIPKLGNHNKEQPVKVGLMTHLHREDICRYPPPNEFTIERQGCAHSEQCTG